MQKRILFIRVSPCPSSPRSDLPCQNTFHADDTQRLCGQGPGSRRAYLTRKRKEKHSVQADKHRIYTHVECGWFHSRWLYVPWYFIDVRNDRDRERLTYVHTITYPAPNRYNPEDDWRLLWATLRHCGGVKRLRCWRRWEWASWGRYWSCFDVQGGAYKEEGPLVMMIGKDTFFLLLLFVLPSFKVDEASLCIWLYVHRS